MNAKLKALITGGMLLTVGGVAIVAYVPKEGVTRAELVDAGILDDCVKRRIACTAFIDGGYVEKEFTLADCGPGDGGRETIWPRKALELKTFLVGGELNCRRLGVVADIDLNEEPPTRTGSCACWQPDAGDCRQADGGTQTRDGHNEFGVGDWVGPGCRPKPCGELFGIRNLPEGCVE